MYDLNRNILKIIHNGLEIISIYDIIQHFNFVIFSYTIKGALFGATIFGSSELGLWKDGETSRELAKLIIAILTPIANKAKSDMPEQVNFSLPRIFFKHTLALFILD